MSVCVWGRRAACGFAEVFPIVDAHVESEVCPLFFALGVPGALSASFERAGLTDVVEERVPVTLSWASADEACAAMLEGGAVALAWSRFSPETRAVVRAEYLASLEPFRRGDRYDVAAEVVFATARKPAESRKPERRNVSFRPWSRLSVESRRHEAGSENDENKETGHEDDQDDEDVLTVAVAGLALAPHGARGRSPAAAARRLTSRRRSGSFRSSSASSRRTALPGAWEEMKTLQLNPNTVLPGRTKELIGLGVAAQIPCRYCIVAHTEFAKLNGASEAEIGEAVAMAAITRHWSTFLNGIQTDETKFRAEIAKIVENVKKASACEAAGRQAGERRGRRERAQGEPRRCSAATRPSSSRDFPSEARAGAWRRSATCS